MCHIIMIHVRRGQVEVQDLIQIDIEEPICVGVRATAAEDRPLCLVPLCLVTLMYYYFYFSFVKRYVALSINTRMPFLFGHSSITK